MVFIHVLWRFVDHAWFLGSDVERSTYGEMFAACMRTSDWRSRASCLTSSQIQHAMIAGAEPLEAWTRRIHRAFSMWMSVHHDRIGPVFSGRPLAIVVEPDRVADMIACIEQQPVVDVSSATTRRISRPVSERLVSEVAKASGVSVSDLLYRRSPKISAAQAILARVAGASSISLTALADLLATSRHRAAMLALDDLDPDARATVRRVLDALALRAA
jgi:hypothetical protein